MEKIITNDKNKEFKIKLIQKGDNYGLDNCLTHFDVDPMIEFWDVKTDQFISRYFLSTLKENQYDGCGITLCGDIPEWSVSYENKKDAIIFAEENKKNLYTLTEINDLLMEYTNDPHNHESCCYGQSDGDDTIKECDCEIYDRIEQFILWVKHTEKTNK